MPRLYRSSALLLIGMLLMGCNATTDSLREAPMFARAADMLNEAEPAAAADGADATAPEAAPAVPRVTAVDPADFPLEQARMLPGQFIWEPEKASGGGLEIRIVMPRQTAYVYRGGTLIGMAGISTGKPGHETPAGSYTILQKRRDHVSNLYPDGDMPFMQRLTWDGIALHGGYNPGFPASHGCVRLPNEFAEILFETTRIGTRVVVLDREPGTMVAGDPAPIPAAGNALTQAVLREN